MLRAAGWPVQDQPLDGVRAHVAAVILDEIHTLPVEALGLPLPSDPRLQRIARPVSIAGLVIGRQRPQTASGVVFVTLEDEYGLVKWSGTTWPSANGVCWCSPGCFA